MSMLGKRGAITKAPGGKKTVYVSNVFAVFPDRGGMRMTSIKKGKQKFNIPVSEKDGLLYDVLLMLHRYGMAEPTAE
jgi:hypothetical protein